jgi:transcriptional regulator with XRE-family HTH domain
MFSSSRIFAMHVETGVSRDLVELMRLERLAFAAKLRLARAVLGWSQSELGFRIGLSQRAVHKIEQGDTEPRRSTVRAIEEIWRDEGIEFEELGDGGFRVTVRSPVLDRPATLKARRERKARVDLGVTAIGHRSVGRA